jgi:hypothetical protein
MAVVAGKRVCAQAAVAAVLSAAVFRPGSGLPDAVAADQEFHVMDANGDGVIDPREAASGTRYPMLPRVFDAVDLDGSGAIEYREWDRARFYLRALDPGTP